MSANSIKGTYFNKQDAAKLQKLGFDVTGTVEVDKTVAHYEVLEYRGIIASIRYDNVEECYVGTLKVDESVSFDGETYDDLKEAFVDVVEEYFNSNV